MTKNINDSKEVKITTMTDLFKAISTPEPDFNKLIRDSCFAICAMVDDQNKVSKFYYSFSSLADIHFEENGTKNPYIDPKIRGLIPYVNDIKNKSIKKQYKHFENALAFYDNVKNNTVLHLMEWIKTTNNQTYHSKKYGKMTLLDFCKHYENKNNPKQINYIPWQRMFSCCERKFVSEYFSNNNRQIQLKDFKKKMVIYTSKEMCLICHEVLSDFASASDKEIFCYNSNENMTSLNEINPVCSENLSNLRDDFDDRY